MHDARTKNVTTRATAIELKSVGPKATCIQSYYLIYLLLLTFVGLLWKRNEANGIVFLYKNKYTEGDSSDEEFALWLVSWMVLEECT